MAEKPNFQFSGKIMYHPIKIGKLPKNLSDKFIRQDELVFYQISTYLFF